MSKDVVNEPVLTYATKVVAKKTGLSTDALYDAVRRGDCPIPHLKVGRRIVWPKALVDRALGVDNGWGPPPGRLAS
jgi:hypothetical protein